MTRKKTKAEIAASLIVEKAYKDFVNPGIYAGPKFDKNTFDIEGFVGDMLFIYYRKKISKESHKKGILLARKLWNEFCARSSSG